MNNYIAVFNFTKDVPHILRNILIDEYVKLRELAIEKLNGKYEKWNKEFDKKFESNSKGMDKRYLNFINKKQTPIVDNINKIHPGKFIEILSNEECDIVGRAKFDKDLIIFVTLREEK